MGKTDRTTTFRRSCAVAALAIVSVLASAGDGLTDARRSPAAVDSWPLSDHDPRGRNFNPGETLLDASNVASLTPAWTSATGLHETWVLAGGRVFRLADGEVIASRPRDGSTLWSYGYPDCWAPYNAAATASRVFVYFDDGCSETGETDQALVTAFDSSTGDILWETQPCQWVLWMGLAGGRLLLETEGPFGFKVLDPATGDADWEITSDSLDGAWAADADHVYFAGRDYDADQRIAASFQLSDGAIAWRRPMGSGYIYHVMVGAGRLFISGATRSFADAMTWVVDKETGDGLYRLPGLTAAAYQPGLLFTRTDPAFGRRGESLTARRPRNGETIWSRDGGGRWERLLLANGLAYTIRRASGQSSLYVYGSDDGRLVLKLPTHFNRVPLAVTGGRLYLLRRGNDAVLTLSVRAG
jgi:outer membrane protein assembly factor BamB